MGANAVEDYYGRVLSGSADLKTDACCTPEAPPPHIGAALARVHEDVRARYYGCGLVAPDGLEGLTVLDLGCGAGQDAFVLAQLVGSEGRVIGVDMTPAQLAAARAHEAGHAERFGFAAPNTRFIEGSIERLDALAIAPDSIDVIVSNCVVNLSDDKAGVFAQAYRALKPGGEFYFADVYADRRLPESLKDDQTLRGECLAGALYWNDFLSLAKACGFGDPRLVAARPLNVTDESIAARLGEARFASATYRLFKLGALEPACEDYGQEAIYRGDIAHAPDAFQLDSHHRFETGARTPVCGNTWRMLAETRFAPHFELVGDLSRHRGMFPGCGAASPFAEPAAPARGCC